jgi:hypothetical protein
MSMPNLNHWSIVRCRKPIGYMVNLALLKNSLKLGLSHRKAGTLYPTESGIALFKFTDQLDQLLIRSLRARLAPGTAGIPESIFEIPQGTVEAEQGGGAEKDGVAEQSSGMEKRRGQAQEEPVGGREVRSAPTVAPQDQELVLEE